MKKEYIVVKFRQEYIEAMPAEKFYEEKESGAFQHSGYETVHFSSKEEAQAYVTNMLALHQLVYCLAPGMRGMFIEPYFYSRDFHEDYYNVLYIGTLEECEEKMKELEDEFPDEATILEREEKERRQYAEERFQELSPKYALPDWMWKSEKIKHNDGFWATIVKNLNEDVPECSFDYDFTSDGECIIFVHKEKQTSNFLVRSQNGLDCLLKSAIA